MLPVTFVYAGLAAALLGALFLARPVRRLGVPTRRRAGALLIAGLSLVALGWAIPAPDVRVAEPRTLLDRHVPLYQFAERHAISIAAPPDAVYRALGAVTAREIRFFRTLTAIRHPDRRGPASIVNAPADQPILDVATRTTFLTLDSAAGREIVLGAVVIGPGGWRRRHASTPAAFDSLVAPGFAKAAMNFRVVPAAGGSLLTTETRVVATDAATRRRFARYWRVIYPGSAIIRSEWLKAVRRRAESGAPPRR